jgi:hypothetical protein
MSKRKSQSDHDEMVQKVAETLIEQGYKKVRADIPSYEKPSRIIRKSIHQGYIPDVTGIGKREIIIEVETDDSIEDKHTEDQWTLFSGYCIRYNAKFLIIVPKGSKAKAEKRSKELCISGDIVEVSL